MQSNISSLTSLQSFLASASHSYVDIIVAEQFGIAQLFGLIVLDNQQPLAPGAEYSLILESAIGCLPG